MKKYFNLRSIMIGISILLCLVGTGVLGYLHLTQPTVSAIENKAKKTKKLDVEKSTPETKKPRVKSPEAKQAVVDADMETMSAYGLVYDYANKGLVEVVQDFLAESGIDPSQVAFTYRNAITGEQFAMNDLQPMTAGSTYKLPLNMLVVDEVAKGKLNLTDRFDITNTYYEYVGEHDNYVAAFDGAMSIPDMQRYSLVYSENTPAYALADRLGGMEQARKLFSRYGQSRSPEVKTFSEDNKTTTDYYIHVLEYLWNHQEKYADLLELIGESFPGEYYKKFLPDLVIQQKPGYVAEALNVDAIVRESTPYLVAIYTAGLGGTTPESSEISGVGLYQLGQLAYVINEWHRVNMNE